MKQKNLFLSIIIMLLISGCAMTSNQKEKAMMSPAILEPQAILKFGDVPVPSGFKLLAQDSYAFENSGVRVGVLRYQGKVDLDRLVNFYKEQMPMYNWNLLNTIEYGERLMNFDRENETCIIRLSTKDILMKGNSLITISLGPKSQLPKKVNKPVK